MRFAYTFLALAVAWMLVPDLGSAQDQPKRRPEGKRAQRGERPEGQRGNRPEGQRGNRAQGQRGDRSQGQRGPGGSGGRGGFTILIITALDVDKNGELSKEEIANAQKVLASLDKNKDGKLTREEYMGPRPTFGGFGRGSGGTGGGGSGDFVARMLENDKNKDGKLAKDEVSERLQGIFDRWDTNKDKFVDKKELEAAAARFGGGNRTRSRGAQGGRGGRPGEGGRPGQGGRPKRPGGGDRPKRPERPGADN